MTWRTVTPVAASLFFLGTAYSAPPPTTVMEIEYLLQHIETSGCEFYRNGSWYDAGRAKAHLRTKYDYLAARKMITTTEDFIDKAASRSSLSGQPYKVKCNNDPVIESGQWMRNALDSYRAASQSSDTH